MKEEVEKILYPKRPKPSWKIQSARAQRAWLLLKKQKKGEFAGDISNIMLFA